MNRPILTNDGTSACQQCGAIYKLCKGSCPSCAAKEQPEPCRLALENQAREHIERSYEEACREADAMEIDRLKEALRRERASRRNWREREKTLQKEHRRHREYIRSLWDQERADTGRGALQFKSYRDRILDIETGRSEPNKDGTKGVE